MKANKDLVNIYTGVEESVFLLKSLLEKAGIKSLYKNDFSDTWLETAIPGYFCRRKFQSWDLL